MTPSVLVSGAGVAGTTAAYWLARHGLRVTVVERASGQRSSGNPVDVRGPALPVAREMGVLAALRERATHADGMRAVDAAGRTIARLPMQTEDGALEIPRADLAATLFEAARDRADFRFDDAVTALEPDGPGVHVTFERGAPERFDLVVGADGLHSAVRRLAFGPEPELVRHLGVWVATLPLGEPADDPRHVLLYNEPGRVVSIHPSRGEALVAFIFRGPARPGLDHRDAGAHRRIVAEAYAGAGWRVPELLAKLPGADVYFDSVSRVHLPEWTRGRITLTGDAASCVSLFGDGSSLAMAGAHTLASALAAAGDDLAAGLRRYEAEHRARTDAKVRGAGRAAALVVPKTRLGLAARNAGARVLSFVQDRRAPAAA
ncbi:FAD-dependent oxidoreductase [Dactylosporangium sp. NPDC000244]|uniref:FAD-dependent oxidoreductase n=1 Tax=Dactylosporangium sp. NPDC000244 TaxID=3154365 RepID=UPI003330BE66